MGTLRDLIITVGILLVGLTLMIAFPIVVLLVVFCVVGYLIFALIHDTRLAQQDESETHDESTDNSSSPG